MNKTPQQKVNEKKNKRNGLENYHEVQTWLRTVSERSRSMYLRSLKLFCEFSGMDPTVLINTRDAEIKNVDHNHRNEIRDLILDFREHLEKEEYAPKTINAIDGSIRGLFTSVLGKRAMINVRNYRNAQVRKKKDLVPTLEELRKILDVSTLEEKFRIIFLAQTGMRISDALALKIEDVKREIDLEHIPLAITYLPEKDREAVGERLTFLASDGVELMKAYIRWRQELGEEITSESPLFASREKRGTGAISQQMITVMLHGVAKKAGLNGDWKYGVLRAHSLRKFFITQMTNHGVQDKVVDFFVGHAITEIDRIYWIRRVEALRKIYADRQQHLNPISLKQDVDLSKLEGIKAKLNELANRIGKLESPEDHRYEAKIVSSEKEMIAFVERGYECQYIKDNIWLVKRKRIVKDSK